MGPVDGALFNLLSEAAVRFGNKTALVCDEQTLSYSDLYSLTIEFSNALAALGVKKGDKVALYLPNILQFPIAFFGALRAGAVVTAISPLHREREVTFQLSDSGAHTIVTTNSLKPIVDRVKLGVPLKQVIIAEAGGFGFLGLPNPQSVLEIKIKIEPETDLASLQYTGGTTGTPKAAMLTHRNLRANAHQFANAINADSSDVFLVALPLFHIYGLTTSLTTPISVGAKMALLSRFTPQNAFVAIEQQKVSVFCGVPTMYQLLLANAELKRHNLSSLRVCISGAASLPPQVQRQFMEKTGALLVEGYGLSEASPVTHCSPVNNAALRVGSIGPPLADTEAKIVDLSSGRRTLGVGEVGELAVKGPQIMKGYWQNPDETAFVLNDGWLLTGDIARIDNDGYFYIVDRKKDLIKHKGYSIYPRELEDILYEHQAVKLCAVTGGLDGSGDEVPMAFVVLKEGAVASAEVLKIFVNDKLAAYKAIHQLEIREELPLSPAGKVLKRTLKEQS